MIGISDISGGYVNRNGIDIAAPPRTRKNIIR